MHIFSHWRPQLTLFWLWSRQRCERMKSGAFDDAKPIVRWFNEQQIHGGGYGSTQATILVYQAIAEYWTNAKEPEYNVKVNIVFHKRRNVDRFNFNRENHYTTRTSKLNSINQNVTVVATGTGEATVKMVSLYYALPKEKESDCQKFNLSVQLIPGEFLCLSLKPGDLPFYCKYQ
ncbi:complement C3-like [Micropterus dolomieu]|uniref:complement C3-like n=1 Tax=Micropterus dolomieu TaxID=147949 RepID=UPI001E8DFD3F|nr:complement C3-like [Micropterus dolomieu]